LRCHTRRVGCGNVGNSMNFDTPERKKVFQRAGNKVIVV
jgi:hypothetical protein